MVFWKDDFICFWLGSFILNCSGLHTVCLLCTFLIKPPVRTGHCSNTRTSVCAKSAPSTATSLCPGSFNCLAITPLLRMAAVQALPLYLAPLKTAKAYFTRAYRGPQLGLIISNGGRKEEDRQQGGRNRMRQSSGFAVNDVA